MTAPEDPSLHGGVDSKRVLGNRAKPDVRWLAEVTGASQREVEGALCGLRRHSKEVEELVERVAKTGRSYYAQFPAPLDLYALVRLARPDTAVETGVASGVSSAFILLGLKSNGRGTLHSIDLPLPRRAGRGNESWAIPEGLASGWAVPRRLRRGWRLHVGRSEDLLIPLLDGIGRLDFYCHDSPVEERHFEFEMDAIRGHLGPGSLVVSDNVDWSVFRRTAESVGAEAVRRKKSSLAAFRVPPLGA